MSDQACSGRLPVVDRALGEAEAVMRARDDRHHVRDIGLRQDGALVRDRVPWQPT